MHSQSLSASTYVAIDQIAGRNRRQQTSQIGRAVGQRHQEAGEARRDVQMVDLEAGVDAAVQAHADRQHGNGGHAIAAGVRGDDQTDGRSVLACIEMIGTFRLVDRGSFSVRVFHTYRCC